MGCKKVLIIEDEKEICELLKEALEFEGYEPHFANNGAEGLLRLSEMKETCIVFLDLMMPIMNGWQFLEEKNKDATLANIPVVLITAASKEKIKTANANYFKGIVPKPINLDHLNSWLLKYCQ